jgi:PAS domain S-box-containing protein
MSELYALPNGAAVPVTSAARIPIARGPADSLLEAQRDVLEMIVKGHPLREVLEALCRIVESQAEAPVKAAILAVDASGKRLTTAAAPSLPRAYCDAIDGVAIDPNVGTCAAAAAREAVVITPDLAADAGWARFRHLPLALGLKAAWSIPIFSSKGRVLGTFGTYLTQIREPSPVEQRLVEVLSRTAALAMEREQADSRQREAARRDRFIAELAAAAQGLTEPAAVLNTTARLLAEHLDADRCAYAEVENESTFVICGDHSRSVPSIVGRWPVEAFGSACVAKMLAGEPFIVRDTERDPQISPEDKAAYAATNIRAVICVPLLKDGRFTAAMAVHQSHPRDWSAADCALVTLVVARCWEALERLRVTRSLRESEARYRAMIEASPECVKVVAADGTLIQMNAAGLQMLGAEQESQVIGSCIYDRIASQDRERFRTFNEQVCQGRGGTLHFAISSLDGRERSMETTAVSLPIGDGTFQHLAVTRDVTDRAVAQRALEESRGRLEHLNSTLREQDRRKDEFLATLAHELRNPLAPIRTGLEVLRQGVSPEHAERVRAMMERQLRHLVRMVDDLLDVSRVTLGKVTLKKERIDARSTLYGALEATRPLLEACGHEVAVRVPQDPFPVFADATRLVQVFSNIISNAAKYTRAGGRIQITAERVDDSLVVKVSDNGVGIPADMLPRIFDVFTQVHRSLDISQGGLGLGLTLVRRLMEMHDGSVTAESAGIDQGSTFTVRLPLLLAENALSTDTHGKRTPEASSTLKILIVDDNVDAAEMLALLLGIEGHQTHVAHDGTAALEAMSRFAPDLAFIDIGLPGMTGYEVAQRIRASVGRTALMLVALTGWGTEEDRRKAIAAGFDAHLVKPVDAERVNALFAARANS